jgi:hypothetical protein
MSIVSFKTSPARYKNGAFLNHAFEQRRVNWNSTLSWPTVRERVIASQPASWPRIARSIQQHSQWISHRQA